jgi:hypothetical protein
MKKTILLFAFLAASMLLMSQTPPTPQLKTHNPQGLEAAPTYIAVYGLDAETTDWLFTYSEDMRCYGSKQYKGKYIEDGELKTIPGFGTLVWALPDNPNTAFKDGFDKKEVVNFGYYDASEDKYYELTSNKMYNFTPADSSEVDNVTYSGLTIYKIRDVEVGNEISLIVTPELFTPILEYEYLPISRDVYRDENIFF